MYDTAFLSCSAPYRTSNRRPSFRHNSRQPTRSGVFSRLGPGSNYGGSQGGNYGGSQGGYVGQPAMATSSWSKVTVSIFHISNITNNYNFM